MPLSKYERKEKLGYGKQREVAEELAKEFGSGYDEALVSLVINDKAQARDPEKVRRVKAAISRRLRMPISEVFPSEVSKVAQTA
jgi:hypothetical protein